jgi:hypothetical protein
MTRPTAKTSAPAHLHGLRVRVVFEAEVLGHYEAGPTAPERIMVKPPGGGLTVVPVAHIEVIR